jgi:organic anion transporter 3A
MLMPFMVLLFFMTLLVAVTQMPVLMVVLRSVEEEEKAFALGIQFVIFRLFGYIPRPIIFGHVIDSTCLLWKQTCEGAQGGRCLIYDIEKFRYKYIGICAGIKVLASLIFFLDWWLVRRRQQMEEAQGGLTVGELVNSVVSLDKVLEREAPEEEGGAGDCEAAGYSPVPGEGSPVRAAPSVPGPVPVLGPGT